MPFKDEDRKRAYDAQWRQINRDRKRDNDSAYKKRQKTDLRFKARRRAEAARYRQRHPLKIKARNAVNNAIRDGHLKRLPCEVCSVARTEAHHEDYTQPLRVRWLCRVHHPRPKDEKQLEES